MVKYEYDTKGSVIEEKYENSDGTGHPVAYTYHFRGLMATKHDTATGITTKYVYDAWGNIVSTMGSMASTLGYLNPLRYRGYVYDVETGLYYLQSRYYNPQRGRFLNADGLLDTSSLVGPNLFAYCGNNPVNRIDTTGHFGEEVWDWIVDAAGAMWDAYQRSYERQQEAQLLNAQMTLVHGPRIFNAGMKAGIANACGSWRVGKLSNHQNSQNNNQPSDGNSVLYAFIGGFITGVVLEIFEIIQENIPEGMD